MPAPGHLWRHVTINTLCSWFHGSAKGFRSRTRTLRSSGDYRNPPPPHEHAGLRKYFDRVSRPEVHIPRELRPVIGRALVVYFRDHGYRILAVAVAKVHAHGLVELPDARVQVRAIVGEAKRKSSRAVKRELPGNVWATGGDFKRVRSRGHHRNVYAYILYDQGTGAWTWSYRDGNDEGMFGRKRGG